VIAVKSIVQSCLLAFSILGCSQLALGQDLGEASAGFDYANRICAGCHAVARGGRVSPNEKAPPFDAMANTRGMNEMALRVWFQAPHPTMPNLAMSPRQKDDVIAYILSLKERQ
jgi:cytochrome c2